MKKSIKIYALHGFLGRPDDFNQVADETWECVDYLKSRELSSNQSLENWGRQFNQFIQKKNLDSSYENVSNILVGYSQGGRLALHALQNQPGQWKAAIMISANPGVAEIDRSVRIQNDQFWAELFMKEPFDVVIKKWNQQSVFSGSQQEPTRIESDYNRQQLKDCLVNWSVGSQQDFRSFLKTTEIPILYISGALDKKYCEIGAELAKLDRKIKFVSVEASGHRVLFDQPQVLKGLIQDWLIQFN